MLKIIQSILKSPIKRQYLQGDSMFYIKLSVIESHFRITMKKKKNIQRKPKSRLKSNIGMNFRKHETRSRSKPDLPVLTLSC